MDNKQEHIKQCEADIKALQENLWRLRKNAIGFGDVLTCKFGIRIALYDCDGNLVAIDGNGTDHGLITNSNFYVPIGINVFADNLFDLDVEI